MKKTLNRMLSLLLCLAMVVGYLAFLPGSTVTAEAETEKTTDTAAQQWEMSELGYYKPYSANWLAGKNPSFEEMPGIGGWTLSDWTAVFQTNTVSTSGNASLKIKDYSTSKEHYAVSSRISVYPGTEYFASAKLYGSAVGVLTMRFYDSKGDEITAATKSVSKQASTAWQDIIFSVVAPEGAAKADVKVSTTAGGVGEVYFDEVAFYSKPAETFIPNASFEETDTTQPQNLASWTTVSSYGNYLVSLNTNADYVHEGNQSLKIALAMSGGKNVINQGVISPKTDVIAGNLYRLSFWVKSEPFEGTSICHYTVNFYNVDGQLLSMNGKVLTDAAASSTYKAFNPTADWQNVVVDLTAPAGATKALIKVSTSSASKAPVYVDELTLERNTDTPQLANPSFEDGFAANGIPNGWGIYESNHCFPETVEKTDGNYSLKIDNTVDPFYTGAVGKVPAAAGEIWKLTVDFKGEGGYVQFRTWAGSGAMISDMRGVGVDIGNGWQRTEMTMEVVPGDAGDPAQIGVMLYISKSSPTVAYFDNIKLERLYAPEPITYSNLLTNPSFEIREQTPGWTAFTTSNKISQTDEHSGGERGNFVLKLIDTDAGTTRTEFSVYYPTQPGKYYQCGVDILADTEVQVVFVFFDADNNPIYPTPGQDMEEYDGKWHHRGVLSQAPEGAVRMRMTVSTTTIGAGTAYIDNVFMGDYDRDLDPDIEGAVSVKSPGWNTNYDEVGHPRTYFTADELVTLRQSVSVGMVNGLGYSAKEEYESLLEQADEYAVEKEVWVTTDHKSFPGYWYDLDVFEDFNTFEIFQSDPEGYPGVFAWGYQIGAAIQERMQVLSLAYAISNDTKYAERAVYYAMKMSDWTPWGLLRREQSPGYSEGAGMDTGYLVTGAATVYDLCYDYMTEAQRVKLSDAILNLGLKELAKDLQMFINHNGWLARVNGLLIGAAAIIEESNKEQVEPYLTRGYNYAKMFLDDSYATGHQEGYNYTEHSVDSMMEGIDVLSRATGIEGFIDHPYFEELLVDWVLYSVQPGTGSQPAVSDMGNGSRAFGRVMMMLAKNGNAKATYYLKVANIMTGRGVTNNSLAKLLYAPASVKVPKDEDIQVTALEVDKFGFGFLRTGFGAMDLAMTMIANDCDEFHNHYDKNSFVFGFNSQWLAADYGYGVVNMGEDHPGWSFGYSYGHNTILVDGKAQSVMGKSTMDVIVNSDLYGHLLGDATGAYGGVLDKFERSAILMNHKDKPYYVIIDELDASEEHVYNWNMYTMDWSCLQVDGSTKELGQSGNGNMLSVVKDPDAMYVQFAGKDALEVNTLLHMDSYGPLIQVNSPKAKKYEYMAIISADADVSAGEVVTLGHLITRMYYEYDNELSNGVKWSTADRSGRENVKNMDLFNGQYLFFRGLEPGDYIEFPFEVENTGEYDVKLRIPKSSYGVYDIFIDGVKVGQYNQFKMNTTVYSQPIGKMTLEAGTHTLRFVLVRPNYDGLVAYTYISCEGVLLEDPNVEVVYESYVKLLESYDDETVLGAKISYGTALTDIVLQNRGTGLITGGTAVTDAHQISLMGIYGDEVTEGFAVIDGTSLKFADKTLLQADGKVTISVDYRDTREPIQNTEEEPEEDPTDDGIPVTYVTTSADADRNITFLVGYDSPYKVTVDGAPVESTYVDGMITFAVPAGNHEVQVVGVHTCQFTEEEIHLEFIKSWANCTEPNVYYKSCYCGEKGTETFTDGEPRGHSWDQGQVNEQGVTVYTCSTCKETKTEGEPTAPVAPVAPVEDNNDFTTLIIVIAVAAVVVAGGAVATVIIIKRKRK